MKKKKKFKNEKENCAVKSGTCPSPLIVNNTIYMHKLQSIWMNSAQSILRNHPIISQNKKEVSGTNFYNIVYPSLYTCRDRV